MCKVSVIVPVYNTENYLTRCLQSLAGQTFNDMEFIIVDDGSTDRSGQIIDNFVLQDKRFRVIHQANRGLGEARNVGIEMARGDYIAFVDSDDWVIYKAYERLLAAAEKWKVDILLADLVYSFEDGRRVNPFKRKDSTVFQDVLTGRECFLALSRQRVFNPMVMVYLYRRAYIMEHGFRFAPILHEDALWSPIVICAAQRMKVMDFKFYGYQQREGSITHSVDPRRYESLLYVAEQLYNYMQQHFKENRESDQEFRYWFYDRLVWTYRYAQSLSHEIKKKNHEEKTIG